MITIFGSPMSSAGRCFWCLEEVGVKYDAKEINFREKEHKSEAYLKINPNGKIPTLVDGDFKLWESMAINFYLAEKYKPELLGDSQEDRGHVHQWSYWSIVEMQPPLIEAFIQLVFVPEDRRNNEVIEKAKEKLPGLYKTLDMCLKNKTYLVGDTFTLADLNVASVAKLHKEIDFDISAFPNVIAWLEGISNRQSFKKFEKIVN